MSANYAAFATAIRAVGTGLTLLFSAPALRAAVIQARTRGRQKPSAEVAAPKLYKDDDGVATEESMKKYSAVVPKILVCFSAAVGLAASILGGVAVQHTGRGLAFDICFAFADALAWVFIVLQCICISLPVGYGTRFSLATVGLVSSLVLTICFALRLTLPFVLVADLAGLSRPGLHTLTELAQLAASVAAAVSFAVFPHRPDVFFKDTLVDRQNTVSTLARLTFSWNTALFAVSRKQKLEMSDLPNLGYLTRSKTNNEQFAAKNYSGRLWWRLIKAFAVPLAQQFVLGVCVTATSFISPIVLYNLLEHLDTPRPRGEFDPILWFLVLGLALAIFANVLINNQMSWLTSSRLETPVGSLLQAMVFQKALRLHETTNPGEEADNKADAKGGKDANAAKTAVGGSDKDKKNEQPKQSKQSVVNHMKLDSGRVTMFCSMAYEFPMSIFTLAFAGGYLTLLLGWKAVVAGLLAAISILPLSSYMSKQYSQMQFSLMKYRDAKANILTEALQGMRQIKFSALEKHWEDKIMEKRNTELRQYWKATVQMAFVSLVINCSPLLLASVALSVYALEAGQNIRSSVIFTSLSLFEQLDMVVAYLPILAAYLAEAWVSCNRLESFFSQAEKEDVSEPGESISFDNATVRWPSVEDGKEDTAEESDNQDLARSTLRNVSLTFPNGKLSVIAGKTGSGKSLLLAAILGEVKLISGSVTVPEVKPMPEQESEVSPSDWIIPSLVAFVSQSPWIEAGTVKENILFGCPLDEARYRRVITACAFDKDIELLVDGDETEVGPKGVTLSGGQKWRLALARAIYSRAGILIMDDVLSAVDAHVGRLIVDEALTGELSRGRTRILATHHAELCLPRASYLVRLHEGNVEAAEDLPGDTATAAPPGDIVEDVASESDLGSGETLQEVLPIAQDVKKAKKSSEEERESGRVKPKVYKAYILGGGVFLWTVGIAIGVIGRICVVGQNWALKELADRVATVRVFVMNTYGMPYKQTFMAPEATVMTAPSQIWPYVLAYIGLYVTNVLFVFVRIILTNYIGLGVSRKFFERMTHAILRAPLGWLDNVPSGRILNRFTSDIFTIDRRLPMELFYLTMSFLTLVTILATSITISPVIIIWGTVLSILYVRFAVYYITTAREVKRIKSIANSPIYDQFSSVLSGLSTIRAFARTNFYVNRIYTLIDNDAKAAWALQVLTQWLNIRMGVLGMVFVAAVAGAVALSGVHAALAGFALTFALRYTSAINSLLQRIASIELGFNAAERVLEYMELETEPEGGKDVPAAWPTHGRVEVDNLTVAYKENLPDVLKKLKFNVEPGERVGIVGRTGAGKSTLAHVMFRILEPREGSVYIDGVNIATVKLTQLRSRLAIIPQDPFLFSGTLRSNLDMEEQREDYDLINALQRVHLITPQPGRASPYNVSSRIASQQQTPAGSGSATPIPEASDPATKPADVPELRISETDASSTEAGDGGGGGGGGGGGSGGSGSSASSFSNLSMAISSGGANLSQGQRQLVCLARAMLARPKIVVLDEATSAVDRGTDSAIQASLREDFVDAGCTVLVIAHRLSTVADFDKVLVLDQGEVAEFGSPRELVERGMEMDGERGADGAEGTEERDEEPGRAKGPGSFWELVKRSAEREKLVEMILGDGGGGVGGRA